jgi:hybrid cluster-associated redox disulfide protein
MNSLIRRETVTITKEMTIGQVIEKHPEALPVFLGHGLGCVGCAVARFENIEQGAKAHGIDVEALIADLNEVVLEPVDKD